MKTLSISEKQIFFIGLSLKIILGSFFASYFLSSFFIPFVDYFINNLNNPYTFFFENGSEEFFPYPALMLFVLSLPAYFVNIFINLNELPIQISYLIYRLPLLLADIGILLILRNWLGKKNLIKLMWLYWLSPVLIYITYIHGQLDVIPIFLLFLSLDQLFKRKILLSSIVFGLALSTKTMVLLSLPFIVLYLFSKEEKNLSGFIFPFISALTFLFVNIYFIFDPSFQQMVFFNNEQVKIFELALIINESYFYFIPACILLLLVRGLLISSFNRDIFLMFLGFSFGIILLFVSPMQGWYFWLIPFLTYFYTKSEDGSYIFLILLQAAYLLYFGLIPSSDYLSIFNLDSQGANIYKILDTYNLYPRFFQGLAFTFLQVTLAVNCILIYQKGIDSYSKHKITSKPFLLGIGGDSGVGKTTISDSLLNVFTSNNTLVVRGDDMHRWQRGHQKWQEHTHLDPKANLLHQEIGMLNDLKQGKKILRKTYDHSDGTFKDARFFTPNNLTIFEGLHPFYLSRQRQLFDLKIFIDPHDDLALHWKIIRDKDKRGYSKETILKNIANRAEDLKIYIESQAKYADILIIPRSKNTIQDIGNSSEKLDIAFDVFMSNSIFLENLIEAFVHYPDLEVHQEYLEGDQQKISISGEVSSGELQIISNTFIPNLVDLGIDYPDWSSNAFGALTLILTYYIFQEAEHGKE